MATCQNAGCTQPTVINFRTGRPFQQCATCRATLRAAKRAYERKYRTRHRSHAEAVHERKLYDWRATKAKAIRWDRPTSWWVTDSRDAFRAALEANYNRMVATGGPVTEDQKGVVGMPVSKQGLYSGSLLSAGRWR